MPGRVSGGKCAVSVCGVSTEVLVLGWKGEHLKIRGETVAEGRQGIVTEVY